MSLSVFVSQRGRIEVCLSLLSKIGPSMQPILRQPTPHGYMHIGLSERYAIYADLFETIWNARQLQNQGDWRRLERSSREQKLAKRLRQIAAFQKLDETHNGRSASANSG